MPDAPDVDAPPSYAACREFAGNGVAVPAHVVSTLAAADVQSPSQCGVVDAPYGIESAGPDSVIRIDALVPGMPYVVRLDSPADLAFYVATGCSTPSGPAESECALFVDASSGSREVGRFVAEASSAYVVVDYYASSAPSNQTFTLDVYPEACTGDAQCTSDLPACVNGTCVQCETSFDCTTAAASRCDTATYACAAGADACIGDDTTEPANDGPAGAVPLVLDSTGFASINAAVCSSPRGVEADFFSFQVTTVGDTWDIGLGWSGTRDLDLSVYDAAGTAMGLSYWEQPEGIRLTFLPIGTYYVRVRDFSSTSTASVGYTLAVQRTAGSGCTTRAQCAAEYRNQEFRGDCVAGACVRIDGAGAVTEGNACDSASDCATGLSCPSFFFVSNADTRDQCERTCANDAGCAALGSNYVCTTYLVTNICVQKCTSDDQCPTSIDDPPASGPWYRLRCDLLTGKCHT